MALFKPIYDFLLVTESNSNYMCVCVCVCVCVSTHTHTHSTHFEISVTLFWPFKVIQLCQISRWTKEAILISYCHLIVTICFGLPITELVTLKFQWPLFWPFKVINPQKIQVVTQIRPLCIEISISHYFGNYTVWLCVKGHNGLILMAMFRQSHWPQRSHDLACIIMKGK